jgi:RNA polymerase sigma-70 factor (ECF subfamily)
VLTGSHLAPGNGSTSVNPCHAGGVIRSSTEGAGPLDEATIRDFLETSYPRLVAAVALVSGSQAAAEDAVQEALARAWERSERGQPIDSLPAWVTRVAMNLSMSRLRRIRVERRYAPKVAAAETAPAEAGAVEDRVDVVAALSALPRRQREVTVLRYYLGLDVAEIARTLELNPGTVKTSLFRAREKLAAALGEPAVTDDDGDQEDDRARLR